MENTQNGYHGYWAKNIYNINPYFGNETQYLEFVDAVHARNMYLMIDVVPNHVCVTYVFIVLSAIFYRFVHL